MNWASLATKKQEFMPLVLGRMPDETVGAAVAFAKCECCPAGQCGGLHQPVFAPLVFLEHYGPQSQPDKDLAEDKRVTSLPKHTGLWQRSV